VDSSQTPQIPHAPPPTQLSIFSPKWAPPSLSPGRINSTHDPRQPWPLNYHGFRARVCPMGTSHHPAVSLSCGSSHACSSLIQGIPSTQVSSAFWLPAGPLQAGAHLTQPKLSSEKGPNMFCSHTETPDNSLDPYCQSTYLSSAIPPALSLLLRDTHICPKEQESRLALPSLCFPRTAAPRSRLQTC
jgi:hypothetical protein